MADARPARRLPQALARNWGWLVALGVLLLLMGVLAVAAPFVSSLAVNAWIGAAFLIAGAGEIAHAFSEDGRSNRAAYLLIGGVYLVGGLLVIFNPLASLVAFSLLIAAMLVVSGAWRLKEGLSMRPTEGWAWMTAAGAAMLLAALVIWLSFPGGALWLLGTLAGVALIMEGWALLLLGLAARRAAA